ncbi:hypothetical protein GCM10027085_63560 [Spirosoma aerophilum]
MEKGIYTPKVIVGDSVWVRLDNFPAAKVAIRHSYAYGNHVIYMGMGSNLLPAIHKARKMLVEVHFYGECVKQLEFAVEGLKWPTLSRVDQGPLASSQKRRQRLLKSFQGLENSKGVVCPLR